MVISGGRKPPAARFALLVLPIWLATLAWFWGWWFMQIPHAHLVLFIPLTLALLYEYTVVPSALLYFTICARLPINRRSQKNQKVAVITLCVPSQESLDIIERQLRAMTAIRYPHDSWILDEGGDSAIRKLARKHGVRYFTRKGVEQYNQASYPFQAKTKSGNVNSWLDKTKRCGYDFFVQLDVDHVPRRDYLHKTLGHFRDKRVAWVQAPSIYGNTTYWTARGAAEQDMGMQGPIQMGLFGTGNTPLIIGSHCTYRTAAIEAIGGFQPTRAEDHLDTLALVANGWRGVFVPKPIATGDGPETLPAFLSQQYAWARSMFQIFTGAGHKYLRKMPLRLRARFVFFESWYPLCAGSFLILFLIPILSAILDVNPIHVTIGQLILHMLPSVAAIILVVLTAWPLMQPVGLRLSWRGVLLHLVRWPIVVTAIIGVLLGRQKPYQITPKGKFLDNAPTLKLYRPFIVLGLLSAGAALYASVRHYTPQLAGQEFFALYAAATLLGVCLIDLNIRMRQSPLNLRATHRSWVKPLLFVMSAAVITSAVGAYALVLPLGTTIVAPVVSSAHWVRTQAGTAIEDVVGLIQ